MSSQEHQALIRRVFDAYNQNDVPALQRLYSPDFVCYVGGIDQPMLGLAANLEADAQMRASFSDVRWDIVDMFGEGDRVAVRRTWRMTHTGPFAGQAPTGQTLSGTAIEIYRIEDGKVAEQWTESDNLRFMQQLGALPFPEREPGL
jgi:steroid delta-isomerase-like uncharacterized protein